MVWNKKAASFALQKADQDVDLNDVVNKEKPNWKVIESDDCPSTDASDEQSWNSISTGGYSYNSDESREDKVSSFFDFVCNFGNDASTVYTTASQRTNLTDETGMTEGTLDDDDAKTKASRTEETITTKSVSSKKAPKVVSTKNSMKAPIKKSPKAPTAELKKSASASNENKLENSPLAKKRSDTRRRPSSMSTSKGSDDLQTGKKNTTNELMNFLFFSNVPQLKKNYPQRQQEMVQQLESTSMWDPNKKTLINARRVIKNPTDVDLKELHELKDELKKELKFYDTFFADNHGRLPNAAEKEPIREIYDYYYGIRSLILVEEKQACSGKEELSKKEVEFQKREQELLAEIEEARRDLDTVHLEVTLKDDSDTEQANSHRGDATSSDEVGTKKVTFVPNALLKKMKPKGILRRKNNFFVRPSKKNVATTTNIATSTAADNDTTKDPTAEGTKESSSSLTIPETALENSIVASTSNQTAEVKVIPLAEDKEVKVTPVEEVKPMSAVDLPTVANDVDSSSLLTAINVANDVDSSSLLTVDDHLESSSLYKNVSSLTAVTEGHRHPHEGIGEETYNPKELDDLMLETPVALKPKRSRSFGKAFFKRTRERLAKAHRKGGQKEEENDDLSVYSDSDVSDMVERYDSLEEEPAVRDTVVIYSRSKSSKKR